MDLQWKHTFVCVFGIFTVLHLSSAQSIDQIIQEAMFEANDTDVNVMHSPAAGVVQVELDMLFKEDEYREMLAIDEEAADEEGGANGDDGKKRKKRKAIRGQYKRWTNNIVPYHFSSSFPAGSRDRQIVEQGMNHWKSNTCIDFQPAGRSTRNYIQFVNGGGCSSYVGMSGGMQPVTLAPGCRQHGTVVHELGHAIGFHHEQTRTDRDGYVTIYTQNVIPSTRFNFNKHSTQVLNNHGVPYDYRSVMHYGQYAFTSNRQRTIVTRDSAYQNIIGTAYGLSFRDIKLANIIYGCNSHCAKKTCPGEGFVGKDCKCWCKGTSNPKTQPVVSCSGTVNPTTKPGPVTPKPVTPAPVTPAPTNCVDNNRHCVSWASRGECRKNPAYMLKSCKKSCRVCNGGGITPSNCRDSQTYCSNWARSGYCNNYYYTSYMRQNCKKSCRYCASGAASEVTATTTAPGVCKDYHRHCASWYTRGFCTSNPGYMLLYCGKSCGTC